MATAPPPPPFDGDRDRRAELMTISWIEFLVALIVMSFRMYARILIKNLGIDDWIMFLSMVRLFTQFYLDLNINLSVAIIYNYDYIGDNHGSERSWSTYLLPISIANSYRCQTYLDKLSIR